MLRDYIKSLTFVAALLLGYTALVVNNSGAKRGNELRFDSRFDSRTESRLETARAAVSIQSQTMPATSIAAPVQSNDFND